MSKKKIEVRQNIIPIYTSCDKILLEILKRTLDKNCYVCDKSKFKIVKVGKRPKDKNYRLVLLLPNEVEIPDSQFYKLKGYAEGWIDAFFES